MSEGGKLKTHREWFERQFGERPTTISPASLKRMLSDARTETLRLERLKELADVWDEQHRASSYAWAALGGKLGVP